MIEQLKKYMDDNNTLKIPELKERLEKLRDEVWKNVDISTVMTKKEMGLVKATVDVLAKITPAEADELLVGLIFVSIITGFDPSGVMVKNLIAEHGQIVQDSDSEPYEYS